MKRLLFLVLLPSFSFSQTFNQQELDRLSAEAKRVTIIRDSWGVAHVYGKTDADAVFGLLYAQCEENFQKVEENNLEMLGRLSEVYGKDRLYDDLQMRLIYDSAAAKEDYKKSPAWFKKLLAAAADGVNFFLYKHPNTKPAVLTHFEPWFALMRTNGSISATQTGGITQLDMRNLYKIDDASTSVNDPRFGDNQQPVTNNQQPATNNQQPATSNQQAKSARTASRCRRQRRNQKMQLFISIRT